MRMGMERAAWLGLHRDVNIDAGMMIQLPSYCSKFKMPAERVCWSSESPAFCSV